MTQKRTENGGNDVFFFIVFVSIMKCQTFPGEIFAFRLDGAIWDIERQSNDIKCVCRFFSLLCHPNSYLKKLNGAIFFPCLSITHSQNYQNRQTKCVYLLVRLNRFSMRYLTTYRLYVSSGNHFAGPYSIHKLWVCITNDMLIHLHAMFSVHSLFFFTPLCRFGSADGFGSAYSFGSHRICESLYRQC